MIRLILIALVLTGCGGGSGSEPEQKPLLVGDSLYCSDSSAMDKIGAVLDCYPGMPLVSFPELPSRGVVFLNGGTNDAAWIPVRHFGASMLELLDTPARVICVLPSTINPERNVEPYREVMIELCNETIDPREYGVYGSQEDLIHLNQWEQDLMAEVFRDYLK